MTVFRIVHEQSLEIESQNQVTEIRPWARIELGYEAIQTGWFRRFRPNWLDLVVLEAVGLHARPLYGVDFQHLRDLGLVKDKDQGRLYARITDAGLADILGCDRKWVGKCAGRLGEKGLLRVLDLPVQYRDSRGSFAGTNAYLLAGDILVRSGRGYSLPTVPASRGYSLPTVTEDLRPDRGELLPTKYITLSSTLSKNESESRGDSAADDFADETGLAPDDEHAGDRPTLDPSGNVAGAHRTEDAAKTASGVHRQQGTIWQRLNTALEDEKAARACEPVLAEIEAKLGFTEIGLRAARLAFAPLPDRRRRVLDDLRRMQGNTALKPHTRQRNVIGILTQNIGVTLGLGLIGDGSLRALADRDDYTVIGGLLKQYGAEAVWLKACEIAGQWFEGDPLDYLRAALRNKREREKAGPPAGSRSRGTSGLGSFDEIDYSKEEIGV